MFIPCDDQSCLFTERHTAVNTENALIPTCTSVSNSYITLEHVVPALWDEAQVLRTFDDTANTNRCLKVSTTHGGVEPEPRRY
jgi:hypothetical protein